MYGAGRGRGSPAVLCAFSAARLRGNHCGQVRAEDSAMNFVKGLVGNETETEWTKKRSQVHRVESGGDFPDSGSPFGSQVRCLR